LATGQDTNQTIPTLELFAEKAGRLRFLVFGNQRRVSESWLEKHGGLVDGVEFYVLAGDGTLEQLR
jgi:hypothetical protein